VLVDDRQIVDGCHGRLRARGALRPSGPSGGNRRPKGGSGRARRSPGAGCRSSRSRLPAGARHRPVGRPHRGRPRGVEVTTERGRQRRERRKRWHPGHRDLLSTITEILDDGGKIITPLSGGASGEHVVGIREEHRDVQVLSKPGQESVADAAGGGTELPDHFPPDRPAGPCGQFAGQPPWEPWLWVSTPQPGRGRLAHHGDAHRRAGWVPHRPAGRPVAGDASLIVERIHLPCTAAMGSRSGFTRSSPRQLDGRPGRGGAPPAVAGRDRGPWPAGRAGLPGR
jgi:hypothetical protein